MSLLDILNQAQAQPQSMAPSPLAAVMAKYMGGTIPVGAGSPSTLPTDPTQAAIDQQIATLSQPAPTTDIPAPAATKKWQKIVGGLADAVSAYGHGLNANAPLTHIVSQLLNTDQARQAIMAQNEQRRAAAADAAKKYGAALKLEQLKGQQTETAAERRFRENQDFQTKLAESAQSARAALSAQEEAAKAQQAQAERDWQTQMEKVRFAHEKTIAAIRERAAAGDKQALEDRKTLGPIMGEIGNLADSAPALLEKGTSPDQIVTLVRRKLDAAMLSPEGRKAAESYFAQEVGPILHGYEVQKMNADLAGGSPQPLSPAARFDQNVIVPAGNALLQRGP